MRALLVILLFSLKVYSQQENAQIIRNAPEDYVHLIADKNPQFKGSLYQFLASNIKFPEEAMRKSITGKVYTTFIIRKDSSIDSLKILSPVHPSLDAEALRVVKKTNGKWIPGEIDKKKVDVRFQMPIVFSIR